MLTNERHRASVGTVVIGLWLAACGGGPPAPPPAAGPQPPAGGAPPALSMPMPPGSIPAELARLTELRSSLMELHSICTTMQTASTQGRARILHKQLESFVASSDPNLPFRKNVERVVAVLGQGIVGDQLSDSQKGEIKTEIEAVLKQLGVPSPGASTATSSDSGAPMPPPPGPGGPGGPGPGGPGPGGPGPGGPGPGGPPGPHPPQP